MIGMCVYGDSDPPSLVSFDGQFEGLAPRTKEIEPTKFFSKDKKLICNYEAMFDDIHYH